MQKPILFTKEGLEKTRQELDELERNRVSAVKELAEARDMGDRSENAAYKSARWKLSGIDRRIRQLKDVIKRAQIVNRPFTGKADIGCTVTVTDGKHEFTYTLVGGYESNIEKGNISIFSPIGKALVGKKEGDQVTVTVPAGTISYQIKHVEH